MPRHRLVIPPVVCALSCVLAACSDTAPPDPRTHTPLVRAAIVQASQPESRAFTGVIAARVQSDLGFRVSGKVLARLVDAGQTVKRGQPLMRLDPVDLQLAAHAQRQALAAAQARAQQAIQDEARYRDLRGTGAISASAYDQINAAADAAKAQLRAAQAQAEIADNASRYAELLADSDGVVMDTLAEPGQVVQAGQVVLRLARAGRRDAVIQLPETLRPALGSLGQATLFGKDGVATPAKLRVLSAAADRLTRTFEARYALEGELADAPLGATVTLHIPLGQAAGQGSVQAPIGALFDAGKGPGVWLIAGKPEKVAWKPVTVLQLSDESARLLGQIQPGDRVVALGAHLLREGEPVRVAEAAGARAAEGAKP